MILEQKPNFKTQDKILRQYNFQHQRVNPMIQQAKKFIELREQRKNEQMPNT